MPDLPDGYTLDPKPATALPPPPAGYVPDQIKLGPDMSQGVFSEQSAAQPGSRGALSPELKQYYIEQAGGDPAKAIISAQQEGWKAGPEDFIQPAGAKPTDAMGGLHNAANAAFASVEPLSNLLIRGLSSVGAVDPENAKAAVSNELFPHDPRRSSGVLGGAVGTTAQAVLQGPSAPFFFAASGGEQAQEQVEQARAQGQQISGGQQAADVIGQAALQFVMGKLAPGGKINAAILDRTPILQSALLDAVKNVAVSTGVHITEAEAQNIASNALTKATNVNPDIALTAGSKEAVLQGAVMGGAGQAASEVIQGASSTPNQRSTPDQVNQNLRDNALAEFNNREPAASTEGDKFGNVKPEPQKLTPEEHAQIRGAGEALKGTLQEQTGQTRLQSIMERLKEMAAKQTEQQAQADRATAEPTKPPAEFQAEADKANALAEFNRRGENLAKEKPTPQVEKATPVENTTQRYSARDMLNYINVKSEAPDLEGAKQLLGNKEYELRDVPIEDLSTRGNTEAKQADIEKYAALPAEKAPAVVADESGQVIDGNRRLEAARLRGDETVKAYMPVEKPSNKLKDVIAGEAGGATFHQKFVERKVLPTIMETAKNAKESVQNLNRFFGTGLSETPQETAVKSRVREMHGSLDRQRAQVEERFKPARTIAENMDQGSRDALVDQMEGKGGPITDPTLAKASSDLRAINVQNDKDAKAQNLDTTGWQPEWVGHLFKWPEGQGNGKRSIAGPESFRKQRVYDTYADAVKAVRASGGEPVYENPIDMAIAKQLEVRKSIEARKVLNEQVDAKVVVPIKPGTALPEGFRFLDDRLARNFPVDQISKGLPTGEKVPARLAAPEAIANTLNQMIAPGLDASLPIFKSAIKLKRLTTAMNFAISAWHIPIVTIRNAGVQVGLAFNNALHLEGGLAAKNLYRALPFAQAKFGAEIRRAAAQSGAPTAFEPLIKAATDAGAKLSGRSVLDPTALEQARRDYKAGDPISAGLNYVKAVGDIVSRPVMEKFVPSVKAGYLASLAETYIKRGITGDELKRKMRLGSDNADNVLGEVARSNQFQHRVIQDVMDTVFSAPKFAEGDIRSGGAFARDLVKNVHALATGKKAEITPAMQEFVGHVIVQATMGAAVQMAYNYATTGKLSFPTSVKDFFMPKTGRKNEDGSDERVMLPTGFSLFTSLATEGPEKTVKNRIAPVWRAMMDVVTNSDYRNQEIASKEQTLGQRTEARLKHVGKALLPFSMQSMVEAPTGQENTPDLKVGGFLGVRKASARESQSPAESLAHDILSQHFGSAPRPAAEVEKHDTIVKLAHDWKAKVPGYQMAVRDAVKSGKIAPSDVANIKDRAEQAPGILGVLQRSSFQPSDLMDIWRAADKDERNKIQFLVRQRINDSSALGREDKQKYIREIRGVQ